MKYRKKPVIIEAMQLNTNAENVRNILIFMGQDVNIFCDKASGMLDTYVDSVKNKGMKINTLEGVMTASIGDYIIRGVNGEFYPCKPDIFEKTYELLED